MPNECLYMALNLHACLLGTSAVIWTSGIVTMWPVHLYLWLSVYMCVYMCGVGGLKLCHCLMC